MPRASEAEVKAIIQTALDEPALAPFLATANTLVTEHLGDAGLSDDLLKQIELWLAAHLVAIRDPRVKSRSSGDLDVTYHGQAGQGLDHTPYGQQVRLLDPTGTLAALMDPGRPWRYRAGSPPSSC